MWDPPRAKSRIQAGKNYVYVYRNQRLGTKDDGIDHDQHPEQVDVGQGFHNDLGAKHERAQHGKQHQLKNALSEAAAACVSS
jgi:hypothetical protein